MERERIGVLSVPWTGVPPKGQGSIAGKTHRTTELLADRFAFTVVGGATGRAPQREHPDIDYVPIDERVDRRYVDRLIDHGSRLVGRGRHLYYQPWYHPLYVRRAVKVFRAAGCAAVVTHEFPQWLRPITSGLPDARTVLWGGADSFIEVDSLLPDVQRADQLIGSSRFLARRFVERLPTMADRTHVVYSGVDVDTFHPGTAARSENRILYAGRITPEKGVHVLVDAFRRLADDHPDLELVVAGPPWVSDPSLLVGSVPYHLDEVAELAATDYRAHLLERAGPHAARLSFVGQLGRDDLRAEMQGCTVFCHPALCEEGFGQVVVEALACGAPTIVTDLGAPPEYVTDGLTGLISPAGDAEALTEALGALFSDPVRRDEMGRAARKLAEEHLSAAASARDLAAVLEGSALPVGDLPPLL